MLSCSYLFEGDVLQFTGISPPQQPATDSTPSVNVPTNQQLPPSNVQPATAVASPPARAVPQPAPQQNVGAYPQTIYTTQSLMQEPISYQHMGQEFNAKLHGPILNAVKAELRNRLNFMEQMSGGTPDRHWLRPNDKFYTAYQKNSALLKQIENDPEGYWNSRYNPTFQSKTLDHYNDTWGPNWLKYGIGAAGLAGVAGTVYGIRNFGRKRT